MSVNPNYTQLIKDKLKENGVDPSLPIILKHIRDTMAQGYSGKDILRAISYYIDVTKGKFDEKYRQYGIKNILEAYMEPARRYYTAKAAEYKKLQSFKEVNAQELETVIIDIPERRKRRRVLFKVEDL